MKHSNKLFILGSRFKSGSISISASDPRDPSETSPSQETTG